MSESNQQRDNSKQTKTTLWVMTALGLMLGIMGVDRIVDALGSDRAGWAFRDVLGIVMAVCGILAFLWGVLWLTVWGRR